MKKTITEWQKKISTAANNKFPSNSKLTQSDRLISIQNQLDDVVASIKVENKILESDDHAHQDPDHRIAALIADILILAEMRQADLETELESVLHWFQNSNGNL